MAAPKNLRQQRFTAEMKIYLSQVVQEFIEQAEAEIDDLKGILVTLSDVRVSADLQNVRGYLLTTPTEKVHYVTRLLNAHEKNIRHALAQRIRYLVRVMPKVTFFPDETELRARRIDEILSQIQKQNPPQ